MFVSLKINILLIFHYIEQMFCQCPIIFWKALKPVKQTFLHILKGNDILIKDYENKLFFNLTHRVIIDSKTRNTHSIDFISFLRQPAVTTQLYSFYFKLICNANGEITREWHFGHNMNVVKKTFQVRFSRQPLLTLRNTFYSLYRSVSDPSSVNSPFLLWLK